MADTADPRERVILPARRYVLMIEVRLPVGGFSSSAIEERLKAQLPDMDPIVWGCIDGVDGAYRKLRQLSRETEIDACKADRVHSAHKALSFFRDMFPDAFWSWKRIGGDHPSPAERPMMAGR